MCGNGVPMLCHWKKLLKRGEESGEGLTSKANQRSCDGDFV